VPKNVTVDFWDVLDLEGRPFDLLPIVQVAGEAPLSERMRPRWAGQIDYLAEVFRNQTTVSGTAALIRTENWPGKVNTVTGSLNALDLAENEEVREDMSFHFDRSLQTLVTQRQQFFCASRLTALLQEITRAQFVISPKLRRDAYQRFRSMTRIAKVEVKVRGPLNDPDFAKIVPSMADFIDDASQEWHAMEVALSLSMGQAKAQSLNRPIMQRIVAFFRRDGNAKSLIVSGNQGDGPPEFVDFINDRLIFSGKVDYSESGKQLDRVRCGNF
jgi:hypothetical protein